MTTGRGQAPDPAPRGNWLDRRPGRTGHGFVDLGAVQHTELILDALAGRRGQPRPPRESTDPAAGLLAALAADVDGGVPASSWSWPWLVMARRAIAGAPLTGTGPTSHLGRWPFLARPCLGLHGVAHRPATRTAAARRRTRAAIAMSIATAMLTVAITMMSTDRSRAPGPSGWFGGAARKPFEGHAAARTATRPPASASHAGRDGTGPLAALPGVWLVPVSPVVTGGARSGKHR